MLETPVLFLIFNRVETAVDVFEEIRKARPKQLFIAADGPRKNNQSDQYKCPEVRNQILNRIDWPCELKTLFRAENLGCGKAVSQAITWFFDHVEQGIILEDDCLPNQSFFSFCDQLLPHYAKNPDIMEITGTNLLDAQLNDLTASYYFSSYGSIWGWATWKRAWKLYDFDMISWPAVQQEFLQKLKYRKDIKNWITSFDNVYHKKIDTWDYQWVYTIWLHDGICIVPKRNLVVNIGFDEEATHTKQSPAFAKLLANTVSDQLVHPQKIEIHQRSDILMSRFYTSRKKPLWLRVIRKIKTVYENMVT
ncbi:hypothetical protein [Pedobacter sp.]|uniref:hypothetical protein n=1 Tax=Pedobacter sp. TaxID=1411316 RepID=UPI0031D31DFC